jgi:single-strand DNA-binding protein
MEVVGTLKVKFDTQKVSERFTKREFVVTTEANTPYPQHVSFQITQDKCSTLDQFNEGDELRIQFNLRGREWNGPQGIKYFNTLEAWRVDKFQGNNNQTQNQSSNQQSNSSIPAANNTVFAGNVDDNDDLPF